MRAVVGIMEIAFPVFGASQVDVVVLWEYRYMHQNGALNTTQTYHLMHSVIREEEEESRAVGTHPAREDSGKIPEANGEHNPRNSTYGTTM